MDCEGYSQLLGSSGVSRSSSAWRSWTLRARGSWSSHRRCMAWGGVGKSELALQYAHRRQAAYSLVWWITADSPAAIDAGLAELTYRLQPDAQLIATDKEAARWALGWLHAHPGWLLILDNVEHRGDVEPLLGRLSGGHVVITSRRDVGWESITNGGLRLDVLDPQAAVELLLRLSGQRDARTAAELAEELGFLPLALQQAGAYLRQSRVDIATYLRDLRRDAAGTLRHVAPERCRGTSGRPDMVGHARPDR